MPNNDGIVAIDSRKSRFTGKGKASAIRWNYVRNLFGEECTERCVVFEDEGYSCGNLKPPGFPKMLVQGRMGNLLFGETGLAVGNRL